MGAKHGLAAGSWWEQRQGSGRRRGELQQQQQAALEGVARAGFDRIPETKPESPMKDKPAAWRPPAGLGTNVPTPRADRAALASPEDRAVEVGRPEGAAGCCSDLQDCRHVRQCCRR